MSRIRPGYLASHSFDRWVSAALRVREEPDDDEEEDDEEDEEEENGDEEEEGDNGYSE
jgi:hypothetical protein